MPDQPSQPAAAIPRWVTVLDILSLVLLGLLLRSALAGGYRIRFTSEIQVSMDSELRLFAWLTGLLLIRHFAYRPVRWHERVLGWIRQARTAETFRATWPAFVLSRALVLAVGAVAILSVGFNPSPPWRDEGLLLLDMHARWDAGWYSRIVREGYPPVFNPLRPSQIAFFPALPLLVRGASFLLAIHWLPAAVIIVTSAFFWGLTYVYRLAREVLTADQAQTAILFLVFYPFAVAYSAILTESIFLLAAAGAFYHFRRSELVKAGIFGLLAGLVRPNGFLLCVPLGLFAILPLLSRSATPLRDERSGIRWPSLFAHLATASLPVVGMLLFAVYLYTLTGDGFAWMKAQQGWGRGSTAGFTIASARWDVIRDQGLATYARVYPIEIFEAAAAFFGLAAVWPIIRRFGLAYGVFVAMAILPPLITMGSTSLGRYTAPLFPIFFWLAAAVPEERRPYWLAAFATGQALVAVLFYTWRPPY